MAQGLGSGILWGVVVGAGAVVGLALTMPQVSLEAASVPSEPAGSVAPQSATPPGPMPETATPELAVPETATPETATPEPAMPESAPSSASEVATSPAPIQPAPIQTAPSPVAPAPTAPAQAAPMSPAASSGSPEAPGASPAEESPAQADAAPLTPSPVAEPDAPAPVVARAQTPDVPASDDGAAPAAQSPAIPAGAGPEAPADRSDPPPPVTVTDTTGPASAAPDVARDAEAPEAPARVPPVPVQDGVPSPRGSLADAAPVVDAAPAPAAPVPAATAAESAPAASAGIGPVTEAAPEPVPDAPAPDAGVRVAQADPAPPPAPEVRINRLPAAPGPGGSDTAPEGGGATADAAPAPTLPGQRASAMPGQRVPAPATGALPDTGMPDAASEGASADPPPSGIAVVDHAIAFDNPDGRPVLSIVLTETADGSRPDPARLAGFPFPLTVALDPARPDAAATLDAYRAAGAEVAMLVRLPEDASAQDVAVAMEVYRTALPRTVAFVDGTDGALQSRREAIAQVVAELMRSGHGFLTASQGFNAGQKLAAREGVPNGLILRALDPADPDAMERALDAGALRAGQDGRAILTAPLTDAALAELAAWALGTRQAVITMGPLSAALDRGE